MLRSFLVLFLCALGLNHVAGSDDELSASTTSSAPPPSTTRAEYDRREKRKRACEVVRRSKRGVAMNERAVELAFGRDANTSDGRQRCPPASHTLSSDQLQVVARGQCT